MTLRRNGERRNNICKYVHESFQEFALRMLKGDGIRFELCFPVEKAEAMIRSVVERLRVPGFFVNVDEVAGTATVTVRKLDCWENLIWEFRKRDTGEVQQVFGDYFVTATETGPFAEMIEAISKKIREAVAVWMNKTAFDALRTDFVAKLDEVLTSCLREDKEALSLIEQDATSSPSA